MSLKIVLATSTALGLLFASGAYADDSNALVIQGNGGVAVVHQDGQAVLITPTPLLLNRRTRPTRRPT
jgi:hypothetical protein